MDKLLKSAKQEIGSRKTNADRSHNKSEYRAPVLLTLGKTVDLVQQNSVGYNLDGAAVVTRTYY